MRFTWSVIVVTAFLVLYIIGLVITACLAAAYANYPVKWYEIVFWPLTWAGLFRKDGP